MTTTPFSELLGPYRRWYSFGLRSPSVLVSRLRSRWYVVARVRLAWQRARRGYGDADLWNLNYSLATLTLAGIRYMRETQHGYPAEFSPEFGGDGWPKWDGILSRIEGGFQAWLDEDGWFHDKPDAEAKFKDGMTLYAHWFGALWD